MGIAEKFLPEVKIRQGKTGDLYQIEIEGVGYIPGGGMTATAASSNPKTEAPSKADAGLDSTKHVVKMRARTLSGANTVCLADFKNDMEQLGEAQGVAIIVDHYGDKLTIESEAIEKRLTVINDLGEILDFYFPDGWKS